MSKHIGNIKQRLELTVRLIRRVEWSQPAYMGYGNDYWTRYIMEDSEGNVLTWKTQSVLSLDKMGEDGYMKYYSINDKSLIRIKATVKAHTEYKEVEQTELTRVKVLEIIEQGKSWAEIEEERRLLKEQKKAEQLASLNAGDKIVRMSYKQYKDHYADCETVIDSYEADVHSGKSIEVIIRKGRLKNSGVRGERIYTFVLKSEEGKVKQIKAVCQQNALARAHKETPDQTWKVDAVYHRGMIIG